MELKDFFHLELGNPSFRIKESMVETVPSYPLYNQVDLEEDLVGVFDADKENRWIRTRDKVALLSKGDLIFSLISGKASIVHDFHAGYLFSQNYIRLEPKKEGIDPYFLVYLLNEDRDIKKQLALSMQGSFVKKYSVKQIGNLKLKNLPSLENQKLIGTAYMKQVRKEFLEGRLAANKRKVLLRTLEGALKDE